MRYVIYKYVYLLDFILFFKIKNVLLTFLLFTHVSVVASVPLSILGCWVIVSCPSLSHALLLSTQVYNPDLTKPHYTCSKHVFVVLNPLLYGGSTVLLVASILLQKALIVWITVLMLTTVAFIC